MDRYGLTDLVTAGKPLSKSLILAQLKANRVILPPSITPAFVADAIFQQLGESEGKEEDPSIPELVAKLADIPSGTKYASLFHKAVFSILKAVFFKQLTAGKIEQEVNSGRKRIDILFRNKSSDGFFFDLISKHKIHCPYVFCECKNYTGEIKNPDFDQLLGRFHMRRGQFGILVCRKITDIDRAENTCRDIINAQPGAGVLVLDDTDLVALGQHAVSGVPDAVDDYLNDKFRAILLK